MIKYASKKYRFEFYTFPKSGCRAARAWFAAVQTAKAHPVFDIPKMNRKMKASKVLKKDHPAFNVPDKPIYLYDVSYPTLVSDNYNDDYYKIACVRNPYTRLLSAFLDKIQNSTKKFEKSDRPNPFEQYKSCKTFLSWLKMLAENDPAEYNPHFRPQDINIYFDKICKMESLQNDLNDVSTLLNIPEIIWEYKNNKLEGEYFTYQKPWREYYDKESIKIVREIYERDFTVFGYDIEDI